jgi:predicted dienelactone hydrolase
MPWGGSRYIYFGVAEHLASYGFVVLGVEHTGMALRELILGTSEVGTPNNISSLYYRPSDVTRTIAFADTLTAAGSQLAGLIDTDHIAVWGHSTGGTTVFQAGGARIDFPALNAWCTGKKADPFAEESCQFIGHEENLAGLYGVDDPGVALFPPLWDARVDALVAAAPGGELHAFGDEGIAAVEVPMLIIFGSLDPIVSPEYNAHWAYDKIGSQSKALVGFLNGDHSMFVNCPAFFRDGCGYDAVWDIDRVHDLVNHFTTVFLLATLKGDTDAAAALAPDAVAFPGITYETTGF